MTWLVKFYHARQSVAESACNVDGFVYVYWRQLAFHFSSRNKVHDVRYRDTYLSMCYKICVSVFRYSLGDARYPSPESASLIEEITKQQMKGVVSSTVYQAFMKKKRGPNEETEIVCDGSFDSQFTHRAWVRGYHRLYYRGRSRNLSRGILC